MLLFKCLLIIKTIQFFLFGCIFSALYLDILLSSNNRFLDLRFKLTNIGGWDFNETCLEWKQFFFGRSICIFTICTGRAFPPIIIWNFLNDFFLPPFEQSRISYGASANNLDFLKLLKNGNIWRKEKLLFL
jgi:hypothetical protein